MSDATQLTYLDFDLAIEALASTGSASAQTYRARVLNSPAGQATVDFTLPFNPYELENYILKIGRTRRTVRSLNSQEGQAARDFGERLYNAVFKDEVRDALRRSLDKADGQADHGLRIRLRLGDAPALLDLPWEYLYDPTLRRFFCHSTTTPLVRYPQQPRPVTPLGVTLPLQVLVLIANPSDIAALDVEGEWRKIEAALGELRARGLVQLTRLENGTLAALQRQLRQGRYHIFHFVGHGGLNGLTGERVLYLEDERGRAHAVGGDYLGTLLRDHRSLRLALLNACEGARATTNDPFAGIAQQLVHQGIPAIIAMQFEITDGAALILAQEFYGALADGYPVEAALAEARKAIFVAGNDVEWGTPVLYSRANDGLLFTLREIRDKETREGEIRDKETRALGTPEETRMTAHLPGRGDNQSGKPEDPPAPSRKIDEPPTVPVQPVAGAVASDEERIAAEKAQAEQAAKRIFRDDASASTKSAQTLQPSSGKRQWWRILAGLVVVIIVGYGVVIWFNAYQINQRRVTAQTAAQATATAEAPMIHATATVVADSSVGRAMAAKVPDALRLVDAYGMAFVEVPAGSFTTGSLDGVGDSDEHPQFEMTTDAFWIGQTEVTNTQYRAFVAAGGYLYERWWTDAGWQWRTKNNVTQPSYWDDSQWNGPNQPVVGVSWYEATAYAAWLAAETGLSIRLPTEAEWEKAARGVDGRTYPWGEETPTDQLLNYKSNVGRTVDVGSYPAGASPYGAFDMAGNVWEWTATQWVANYDNYLNVVYNNKEGDVIRTLRGGSWNYDDNDVRSASRGGYYPDYRTITAVFVWCSPPAVETADLCRLCTLIRRWHLYSLTGCIGQQIFDSACHQISPVGDPIFLKSLPTRTTFKLSLARSHAQRGNSIWTLCVLFTTTESTDGNPSHCCLHRSLYLGKSLRGLSKGRAWQT